MDEGFVQNNNGPGLPVDLLDALEMLLRFLLDEFVADLCITVNGAGGKVAGLGGGIEQPRGGHSRR